MMRLIRVFMNGKEIHGVKSLEVSEDLQFTGQIITVRFETTDTIETTASKAEVEVLPEKTLLGPNV